MRENTDERRDLYAVLGVASDADDAEIKRAFRSRARQLHPDVSGGPASEERFRELSAAYAILSEPEWRRLYDRLGWRGRGGGVRLRRGAARLYASNPRALFEDLESLVAAGAGRRPKTESRRVVGEIELDEYEAHLGTSRTLEVDERTTCPSCAGTGHWNVEEDRESGRFVSVDPCLYCQGVGQVANRRPVEIVIPPRVRDLDRIPVGAEEATIIRIVPARDRIAVRVAASIAFLASIGFLLFLLAL